MVRYKKKTSAVSVTTASLRSVAPLILTVGGGFVPFLFCLVVLYLRHRTGMRGPNGFANSPPSEVLIKPGWSRSGACAWQDADEML